MTRLHDQRTTPVIPIAKLNYNRETNQVTFVPATDETDFEALAQKLNPVYHDVRRRPGSISDPR